VSISSEPNRVQEAITLPPLEAGVGLRQLACDAIKRAITEMDIYGHPTEIRLDERQLAEDLRVSRTPIREALTVLEQEGFVRSVPRRGVYVVRKTKREIVEMIMVWAAIESMAAGLAAARATPEQLAQLRRIFSEFEADPTSRVDEYSQANMAFHKAIIQLSGCDLMTEVTENLFIHMRAVRAVTMRQSDRARRSVRDHSRIVAALERRDAEMAEKLVREHTMGLAAHIEKHGDWIDGQQTAPPPAAAVRSRQHQTDVAAAD
jgi:DNA-binding GntR family transcriptional regulator